MSSAAVQVAGLNPNRAKLITFPREHGAWGMLLIPLATGAVVAWMHGGRNVVAGTGLVVSTLAIFLLRTPVEALLATGVVKAKSAAERQAAWRAVIRYGLPAALGLGVVLAEAPARLLLGVGAIAAAALALQGLIGRESSRARTISQLVASGGLTSTALAAYLVVSGTLPQVAYQLWALNWLFAAEQILFVQMRIHTTKIQRRSQKWRAGRSYLAGAGMIAGVVAAFVYWLGPALVAAGFLPVLVRTAWWFATEPKATSLKRVGMLELGYNAWFGVVVGVAFSLGI